jgi:hypothetical protein
MLDPVHHYHLGRLVDAVDDPIIAPACGEQPGELSDKWLPEPIRVLSNGPVQGSKCGMANLRR